MDKVLFVVNPFAKGGQNAEMASWLESELEGTDHKVVVSENESGVEAIVRQASADGFRGIASVGGDGTASHTLRAIHDLEINMPLAIFSNGSGNDVRRALNLPMDPKEALYNIINGEPRPFDYGVANGQAFLNSASMGFDVEVIKYVNRWKGRFPSSTAYRLGVAAALFTHRPRRVSITVNGAVHHIGLQILTVSNGPFYGGGFSVCPMAKMDDGIFNYCVLTNGGHKNRVHLLYDVLKEKHLNGGKQIIFGECEEIEITSSENLYLDLDGELMEANNGAKISIVKGGLQLFGI